MLLWLVALAFYGIPLYVGFRWLVRVMSRLQKFVLIFALGLALTPALKAENKIPRPRCYATSLAMGRSAAANQRRGRRLVVELGANLYLSPCEFTDASHADLIFTVTENRFHDISLEVRDAETDKVIFTEHRDDTAMENDIHRMVTHWWAYATSR